MATQAGLDRVAQINQTIATQGQAAPNPTAGKNAVTSSSSGANPHDLPSYNPANDPTTNVFDPKAPTPNIQPTENANGLPNIDTGQPNPKTVDATKFTTPNIQATPEQTAAVANATKQVQSLSAQVADRQKQGLQAVKSAGVAPATSQGQASTAIQQYTPGQSYDSTQTDLTLKEDPIFSKILKTYADAMDPKGQSDSLVQQYDSLRKSSGIDAINTELMNSKRIIDGTEDDIRSEITAASGFATDSQVMALASARNKTLIKNYNTLLDTKNSLNEQINTTMQLAGQDRTYAQQKMAQQLDIGSKLLDYRDKFQNNAKENYNNIVKAVGYQGLLQSTNGDPYQTSLIEKTLGLNPGGLQQLATAPKPKDFQFISGTQTQASGYFDKSTGKFTSLGGGGGSSSNSNTPGDVPSTLQPYLNTSSSGVQYIDASTLQGSASQKKGLIDQASALGLKVITNKNTAADLVNIKDANSKLDTIQNVMSNIAQPNWLERSLGGLGLTKLSTLAQSDPRKAAAGVMESVGLDVLKAISGVQGFRGNQAAIQQITDHLPKVTDTVDTVNQKIAYVKALISDREDAAVGENTKSQSDTQVIPPEQIPQGFYQASDGLLYPKK